MKQVALDTNIAIEFLNNNEVVINRINKFEVVFLPIIVCGELLFGAINSDRRRRNEKKYIGFIESCRVINTNDFIANKYAEIRLELKKKGKPIPENDIWIAALCIVYNIPLFSNDKHFKVINELMII